jgi:hypothetical protein
VSAASHEPGSTETYPTCGDRSSAMPWGSTHVRSSEGPNCVVCCAQAAVYLEVPLGDATNVTVTPPGSDSGEATTELAAIIPVTALDPSPRLEISEHPVNIDRAPNRTHPGYVPFGSIMIGSCRRLSQGRRKGKSSGEPMIQRQIVVRPL